VYWDTAGGPFIYLWGEADHLKRFRFDRATGKFDTTPVSSTFTTPARGMPGAMLSLSANGRQAGTGLIWAAHPTGCTCAPLTDRKCQETRNWCDANENVVPGTLQAIDASTLQELWNSDRRPGEKLGNVAKFTPVTIANGMVYVPTFSDKLVVYGLQDESKANSKPQRGRSR
jgi:outer membrane protein assembly factor BamB